MLGGVFRMPLVDVERDLEEIQLLEEKTKQEINMLQDLSSNLSSVSQEERKAVLNQNDESDSSSPPIAPLAFIGTVLTSQAAFFTREYQRIKEGFDPKSDSDVTLGEIVQYRLDYYLSTNPYAKALLLLNSTFLVILLGGMILSLTQGEDIGSALWESWTYVADPGTQVNAERPGLRAIALAITVGGLVVFALMVGLITESVSEQVEDFRKGKSRVLEHGHTLILGFNDKCLSIIEELVIAFESVGGGTIVVLSDRPKEEMESILQGAIDSKERRLNLRNSQVIFRSGDPLLEQELFKVGVTRAKSIIALTREDMNPDDADSLMLRQVLSLKGTMSSKAAANTPYITIELQDIDNKNLVQLVSLKTEILVSHDMIGQLMISCSRQPGLAYVMEAIFSFEGSEFYFKEWPELIGYRFGELVCRFDDAIVMGVRTKDGEVLLNADRNYRIAPGDELICLAEDDESYSINDGYFIQSRSEILARFEDDKTKDLPVQGTRSKLKYLATQTLSRALDSFSGSRGRKARKQAERILFCGWRRDMADMIKHLDGTVEPGSELWLLNTVPVVERNEMLTDKGNKEKLKLKRLMIKNAQGNPTVRRDLQRVLALDEFGFETGEYCLLTDFDCILILADESSNDGSDLKSTDGRSLASFLLISDIRRKILSEREDGRKVNDFGRERIISEILDAANTKSLLRELDCKGYVMSNKIISNALAQVAENSAMNTVMSELLGSKGNELFLEDASEFVDIQQESAVPFWEIALRASQKNMIAIGYKAKGIDFSLDNYIKTLVNPTAKDVPRVWEDGDLIVLMGKKGN
uniref:RCK N-terminal domain-containing protein n=1 Tax=Hanusia phi TaxID=3032 RepID=A0A7S0EYY4_9CRYP